MKSKFIGHYSPNEEEFKLMWETGIFVFDTNVLLDFFRYSDETVKELFKILNIINDRIWIPNQVAEEYHTNLTPIISEQVKKYDDSLKTLSTFKEQIEQKRNHPFLDEKLKDEVVKFCVRFDKILSRKRKKIKNLITNNPIKEKIATVFEGKVGEKLSEDELEKIYAEGKKRFDRKIPPGYMDMNKLEPKRYNDLVIWKEILNKNNEINVPIIFITRDTKEDWFLSGMGMTISPRPELIEEFKKNNDNLFYIYTTSNFLNYANKYLNANINKKSIDEILELISKLNNDYDSNDFSKVLSDNWTSILQNTFSSDSINKENSTDNNASKQGNNSQQNI